MSSSSKPPGERAINITPTASSKGLRQKLDNEAARRGLRLRPMVAAVYRFAVANQKKYQGALKNGKQGPGEHIGALVDETVARKLESWAKQMDTARGDLCCYLLLKTLEDGLLDVALSRNPPAD